MDCNFIVYTNWTLTSYRLELCEKSVVRHGSNTDRSGHLAVNGVQYTLCLAV